MTMGRLKVGSRGCNYTISNNIRVVRELVMVMGVGWWRSVMGMIIKSGSKNIKNDSKYIKNNNNEDKYENEFERKVKEYK